jgi:hypothetical protein
MRCPLCQGPVERIVYEVDPLPGIVGDQVRVTLLFCALDGVVDREAEMVVAV